MSNHTGKHPSAVFANYSKTPTPLERSPNLEAYQKPAPPAERQQEVPVIPSSKGCGLFGCLGKKRCRKHRSNRRNTRKRSTRRRR